MRSVANGSCSKTCIYLAVKVFLCLCFQAVVCTMEATCAVQHLILGGRLKHFALSLHQKDEMVLFPFLAFQVLAVRVCCQTAATTRHRYGYHTFSCASVFNSV